MNELLPDETIIIHRVLERDGIPHGFGGAIALAFCGIPRYTDDIDINIALPVGQHGRVLDSLSTLFAISDRARAEQHIRRDAQVRLWWNETAVDLFFADVPFHESIAARTREVDYVGTMLPVISAEDLIICKAAYNRGRDWPDIENIFQVQRENLDQDYLRHWLSELFGDDDERVRRVEGYIREYVSIRGAESE